MEVPRDKKPRIWQCFLFWNKFEAFVKFHLFLFIFSRFHDFCRKQTQKARRQLNHINTHAMYFTDSVLQNTNRTFLYFLQPRHTRGLQATTTKIRTDLQKSICRRKWTRRTDKRGLLLVVVFAIKLPLPEVTAGGQGLLAHGALQTFFVPRRVVDPHQEAVRNGTLASLTHGRVTVAAWKSQNREI